MPKPALPKILLVAGARPNFMKIAPIIRELNKRKDLFDFKVVHTGQHYDREMSDVFFQELDIPNPDYTLQVGSGTHAEQTAKIMIRFEEVCVKENPWLVLVVGDVNSTLACSIVAKKNQIAVAHVEAGLRSGDRRMPEEINRLVTDSISDYFFVTEQSGVDHLLAEGHSQDRVFFVGHVMIDNLFFQLEKVKQMDPKKLPSSEIKEGLQDYGVVTLHRPSNVDDKDTFGEIIQALTEIGNQLPLIFPIHPRTQGNLEKFNLSLPDSIIVTKPLSYMDFLNLFRDAKLVLTDSGGIQEETTALGVPCLTLRENTERPITVTDGTNKIVGTSKKRILEETQLVLSTKAQQLPKPPLWDGLASQRIVEKLKNLTLS